ncbi:MAG: NusG domain II-containing protein [Eubacterium sp.]
MRRTRLDLVVFVALFAVGLLLAGFVYLPHTQTGSVVEIRIKGKVTATYPLSSNIEKTITTDDGNTNTFCIKNRIVTMKDASCSDRICVHTKGISKTGESIVCLPHQVVLAITSSAQEAPELDGISG